MSKPDPIYALLGPRIRALREAKGLTLEQLGDAIGLKKQAVWHMEQGRTPISVAKVFRVAAALGVRPAMIIQTGDGVYENHHPQDAKTRETRLREVVQQAVGGIIRILDDDASGGAQAQKRRSSRNGGESPTLGG